jgi:hypothetical protein
VHTIDGQGKWIWNVIREFKYYVQCAIANFVLSEIYVGKKAGVMGGRSPRLKSFKDRMFLEITPIS